MFSTFVFLICKPNFSGMDLLKHGESAYPADAWVEQQYMKEDAFTVSTILLLLSPSAQLCFVDLKYNSALLSNKSPNLKNSLKMINLTNNPPN